MKSVLAQAAALSTSRSLVFFLYAAGYNLGAFLVVEERAHYYNVFQSVI